MKSLRTLIKIHQHQLDALRRDMTSLQSQRAQLEAAIGRLQNDLQTEAEKVTREQELAGYFGAFAERTRQRQDDLRQEIERLEEKMDALREEIAEAFSEVKKYEIALEKAHERERAEQQRKETIEMDEVASQRARRMLQDSEG